MRRNLLATYCVFLMTAAVLSGCAGAPATEHPPESADSLTTGAAVEPSPRGPFEAAEQWAAAPALESAPKEVAALVDSWHSARVERVWAAGEQYRAIVAQKSTAEDKPAVLLVIKRSADGQWQVVDEQPTTSTYLWSEL